MVRRTGDVRAVIVEIVRAWIVEERSDGLPNEPRQVDEICLVADEARLASVIAAQLENELRSVPPPLLRWRQATSFEKLAQRADLTELSAALDGAGVRWLLLKGPVLDQVVYRVSGLRRFTDLDVLVHPEDFRRAWKAVLAIPAGEIDRNWARIAQTEQSEISLQLRHGTLLDLHWHVISNKLTRDAFGLDIRRFFDELQMVRIDGRAIPTLSRRDTVLYTALHASISGGHEARWLLDLQQCLEWCGSTAELADRARELNLGLVLAVMLQRLRQGLDLSLRVPRGMLAWTATPWLLVCRAVGGVAPMTLGRDNMGYSGRAVIGATRPTLGSSVRASVAAALAALRAGRNRRAQVVDRRILHDPGGTVADQEKWLRIVETS